MLEFLRLKKKKHTNKLGTTAEDLVMVTPAVICFFIFCYLPMFGAILAFKRYNYSLGILGSPWCGFDNFEFFFTSQDAWRVTRNTLGYAIVFNLTSTIAAIAVALMLFEVTSRKCIKTYQTIMILPHFMSYVIIGYITYILFREDKGVFNNILIAIGAEPQSWYSDPKYWPFILPVVNLWKSIGMSSIMYYAALMGIDSTIYEAAVVDGANRWQQIKAISLPELVPMIIILTIMALGSIFRGDFGLFYQIPRDIGALYPTTDVIDTYIYRGLTTGDVGVTSAVGLFQSVVGLITVVTTNKIVNKVNSDLAMF